MIGAGSVSDAYLRSMRCFPYLIVHAIGDLHPEAAKDKVDAFGVGNHGGPETVLHHPDVDIVVNPTNPAAHVEVTSAALAAGWHVWSEKPLSLTPEDGRNLLTAAQHGGLRVGCAPDTILGPGPQAACRVIEREDIGRPLTVLTQLQGPGPEYRHPNLAFFYQEGAGPLFDMALCGVDVGPRAGTEFDVRFVTHVGAVIRPESGGSAQSVFGLDAPFSRSGVVEITGTDATLALPDPDRFDGEIRFRRRRSQGWKTLTTTAWAERGHRRVDRNRGVRGHREHDRGPSGLAGPLGPVRGNPVTTYRNEEK
ncbi:Gfo/Idh/MocA family oxidoreductase [Streptomyces sp. NPDC091215]|uniref:Gfo/Idh/MocA family protein n=1 Tax=Streptomyces sp. NPDC091215 TaxID=3155192 RepID=UPI00342E35AA